MTPKVFVKDLEGKPLLPTHPARARKLLREGKAKVSGVVPFTIQLQRVIENPVGSFVVGLDDGVKYVGIAVVNEKTKEVVFRGTIQLRQDVSIKIKQRAQLRRSRRSRKLRHRQARFLNRKHKSPQPSIRSMKETILRVVRDLKKVLNITRVVIEQGQFDVASLAAPQDASRRVSSGRKLVGVEFQESEYEGRNFRAKVLFRDDYTCQHCESKEKLQAHHIKGRMKGGTNTPKNGITLCEICHDSLHAGEWKLNKQPADFKYPMRFMQGKRYIYKLLEEEGFVVSSCLGWMTSEWRKNCSLEKSHVNDAIAMVTRNYSPLIASLEYTIIPKRAKVWEANPTKKSSEKFGFKHYDLIKASHRTKGWVIGSVRALKEKVMTLRTKEDDNFPVSYKKSRLLCRFNRIIYLY